MSHKAKKINPRVQNTQPLPLPTAEQADTATAAAARRDGVGAGAGGREGALRAAAPLAGRLLGGNPQSLPPVRANLPPRQVPGSPDEGCSN